MNELAQSQFRSDHPSAERTIFLIMPFDPSPLRSRIHRLVQDAAASLHLDLVRADDRDYSGELWTNVKLCMDHSTMAIAVFDDDTRDAQNLGIELGYMFAKDASCLILREQSLGVPPTMLAHRLHTSFSALDLEGTFAPAVQRWLAAQRRRTVA